MKLRIAVLLVLLSFVIGCGQKKSIVGTWNTEYSGLPAVVNFKPDGTFTIDMKQGEMTGNVTGTYTLDEDKLTVTGGELKTENVPAMIADPLKEKVKTEWNRTGAITWDSDDTFRYSEGDSALTFERDKPAK